MKRMFVTENLITTIVLNLVNVLNLMNSLMNLDLHNGLLQTVQDTFHTLVE